MMPRSLATARRRPLWRKRLMLAAQALAAGSPTPRAAVLAVAAVWLLCAVVTLALLRRLTVMP